MAMAAIFRRTALDRNRVTAGCVLAGGRRDGRTVHVNLQAAEIIFVALVGRRVSERGLLQMASQVLLASLQRRAMMASAPAVVQRMPDCLTRWPMTDLHLLPRRRSRRTGRGI
jgi:hypothetical protein